MSPVDGEPQLLYLEPDDEITSVIRRLRGADAGRVVLVAPGRSRATSSVVALRLLGRAAADSGRSVALVADTATRALAGEAGIAAFGSVAEATSPNPAPADATMPTRAPIHVVRGLAPARSRVPAAPTPTDGLEETMAVHLPPPEPRPGRRARPRRPPSRASAVVLAGVLLLAIAAGAAALPGATVSITLAGQAIGPNTYSVSVPVGGNEAGTIDATTTGTATGEEPQLTPATGTVIFYNYSYVTVEVPEGTSVSAAGAIFFTTDATVVAPPGTLSGGIVPGQVSVGVTAVEAGLEGNVSAQAIDRVENKSVDRYLQAFPQQQGRRVANPDATSGGDETTHTVVQQSDVDAAVTALESELATDLAARLSGQDAGRIYAGGGTEEPQITIPEELVGTKDTATFQLSGTLAYNRAWASKADVEAGARERLASDAAQGTSIVDGSVEIEIGAGSTSGDKLVVPVMVRAVAAPALDEGAVRDAVAGKTEAEARTALAYLGEVEVTFWPGWVDRLPRLTFRIAVEKVLPSRQ